ncbi:MAG TPA: hypothetical protein VJN70_09705 [Gemmatimonadaceae bacterium]|nr:hypothetical protein [Gemmatimonadaceae bacterium]
MADSNERTPTNPTAPERGRSADWATHDEYWRDNYGDRPYTKADRAYEHYQPAYKYGHESSFFYGGRPWDNEVETDLSRGWEQARGDSNCSWDEVKDAVRDAYERTRVHATV